MASVGESLAYLYKRLTSSSAKNPRAQTTQQPAQATRSVGFLDLPRRIRSRVYCHLFAGNVVQVCSYNKDKTAEHFSRDERCQILLTCRQVCTEARPIYYTLSIWKFTRTSSLNYFTRGVDDTNKLRFVRRVVITNQHAFEDFADYVHFLPGLESLVVDIPGRLSMPQHVTGEKLATALTCLPYTQWWQRGVLPFLIRRTERKFSVYIGIEMEYRHDSKEMVLLDVDRGTAIRNFRPVNVPVEEVSLHMPSSDDVDARNSRAK